MFSKNINLDIEGKSNLPKAPYLICSNHTSHKDSAVIMIALEKSLEHISFFAAYDYWFSKLKWQYLMTKLLYLIPIDRRKSKDTKMTLSETIHIAKLFLTKSNENILVIYPQGSRKNKEKQIKKGAALIANQLGIPVVPTIIKEVTCLERCEKLISKKTISIQFKKPLYPNNGKAVIENRYDSKEIEEFSKAIEERIFDH